MTQPRRKIVFLNRSYWPDVEATGQLLTDLCAGLADQFEIHVVCGQPNSPESGAQYIKDGKQIRDGVSIHRLPHRHFHKRNPFGRILNLLSFYFAANRFLKRSRLNADIVVSETDPFLLPLAGKKYAKRTDALHCVYLQDIYPDVAEAVGKSRVPMVATTLRRQLRSAYNLADRIVVLGRCMQRRLTDPDWNLCPDKIEIIPNWADCHTVQPIPHHENAFRQRLDLADDFIVMHSGNMGLTQRLDVLLDAAADPQWPEQAKLLLVGNGASRDRLLAHFESLDLPEGRVRFVNYQPRSALSESLSAADVHVVSMHENITGCLCPSKLYGIMAAGRRVIAIADSQTDLCQTVMEQKIGSCVAPGDPAAIARAVARAYQNKLESEAAGSDECGVFVPHAREAACQEFDRPVVVGKFADLFHQMLADRVTSKRRIDNADLQVVSHAEGDTANESDPGVPLTL